MVFTNSYDKTHVSCSGFGLKFARICHKMHIKSQRAPCGLKATAWSSVMDINIST